MKKKSLLLLGPRQTGKSTLLKTALPGAVYFNLAEADTYRDFSAYPERLRESLPSSTNLVVIDEAQKIPEILDEVQVMLDRDKNLRVVLTGSSARKLKRSKINLLPGRIWKRNLHPLTYIEIGELRIIDRIQRGSLPGIIDSDDFREELRNYIGLYLDEEVRAEGLTRNIASFNRFLSIAALRNAEQVNYSNIAQDLGLSPNTVRSFFEIIEDTLVGYRLPSFRKSVTRKAVAIPKFYLFDLGVTNALLNRFDVSIESDIFGKSLEHLIFLELKAYIDYHQQDSSLHYWRSQSKFEVDFLVNESIAIEVKAKKNIQYRDLKGIGALSEEIKLRQKIVVCQESRIRRTSDGISILPVEDFLKQLWAGELF